jgi:hypothetical protein
MIEEAIKSPFILEKIKRTSWEKRSYIKTLLLLYRLMQKQRLSPAEGQLYFLLRNKYQVEFLSLLKESYPLKYQIFLEEQEKLFISQQEKARREQDIVRLIIEEERKEYEQWMALQKTA